MAGFMTKLNSYLYNGEVKVETGATLKDGMVVLVTAGSVTDFAASKDTTTKLTVVEKDVNLGDEIGKGIRVRVDALNGKYYLVEMAEPHYEINNAPTYDTAERTWGAGAFVRLHPLSIGEEFVTNQFTGSVTVGTTQLGVDTDGTLA